MFVDAGIGIGRELFLALLSSNGARNGFLDSGRPFGATCAGWNSGDSDGDGIAGDTARLRKGLLELRLRAKPGEGLRSGT